MATTIDKSAVEYVGNQLHVVADDYGLPEGYVLPTTIRLCAADARRRGVYLGRSWYLQSTTKTPANTVDLVHFTEVYGDDCLDAAWKFLAHHGFRCVDQFNGEYVRAAA